MDFFVVIMFVDFRENLDRQIVNMNHTDKVLKRYAIMADDKKLTFVQVVIGNKTVKVSFGKTSLTDLQCLLYKNLNIRH